LTKSAHFFDSISFFGVAKVAKLFMDNVIRLHSWPTKIVSDRD